MQTALARYRVAERSDGSEFRRKARLLASLWREEQGLAPGMHHPRGKAGSSQPRVLGSRLDPHQARAGRNFLTPAILRQVRKRLAEPQAYQLIQEERLWGDLLSSQPMCFNLFGELAADLELATRAAQVWWPGRVAQVTEVRFEWSPGRRERRYLGNRTAFDAVLLHTTPTGGRGFIGIETNTTSVRRGPPGRVPSGWRGMWRSPSAAASSDRSGGRRWSRRAWSRSGWIICWPCRC